MSSMQQGIPASQPGTDAAHSSGEQHQPEEEPQQHEQQQQEEERTAGARRSSRASRESSQTPSEDGDGRADGGSDDAEEEPQLDEEASLAALRCSWHTASFVQFCRAFGELLALPPFTSDMLEKALVAPSECPKFWAELMHKMLRRDVSKKYDERDAAGWERQLRSRISGHWQGVFAHNPLRRRTFLELAPIKRAAVLYALCDWKTHEDGVLRNSMKQLVEGEPGADALLRCQPIGEDASGCRYYHLGGNDDDPRVYKEALPRKGPSSARSSAAGASRSSTPAPAAKGSAGGGGSPGPGGAAPPTTVEGAFLQEYGAAPGGECASWSSHVTTLEQLQQWADKLRASRSSKDKALCAAVTQQLLPRLQEAAEARRRAEEKAALLAATKRSSRLVDLEAKREEEERRRRAAAEEERQRKEEEERERERKRREQKQAAGAVLPAVNPNDSSLTREERHMLRLQRQAEHLAAEEAAALEESRRLAEEQERERARQEAEAAAKAQAEAEAARRAAEAVRLAAEQAAARQRAAQQRQLLEQQWREAATEPPAGAPVVPQQFTRSGRPRRAATVRGRKPQHGVGWSPIGAPVPRGARQYRPRPVSSVFMQRLVTAARDGVEPTVVPEAPVGSAAAATATRQGGAAPGVVPGGMLAARAAAAPLPAGGVLPPRPQTIAGSAAQPWPSQPQPPGLPMLTPQQQAQLQMMPPAQQAHVLAQLQQQQQQQQQMLLHQQHMHQLQQQQQQHEQHRGQKRKKKRGWKKKLGPDYSDEDAEWDVGDESDSEEEDSSGGSSDDWGAKSSKRGKGRGKRGRGGAGPGTKKQQTAAAGQARSGPEPGAGRSGPPLGSMAPPPWGLPGMAAPGMGTAGDGMLLPPTFAYGVPGGPGGLPPQQLMMLMQQQQQRQQHMLVMQQQERGAPPGGMMFQGMALPPQPHHHPQGPGAALHLQMQQQQAQAQMMQQLQQQQQAQLQRQGWPQQQALQPPQLLPPSGAGMDFGSGAADPGAGGQPHDASIRQPVSQHRAQQQHQHQHQQQMMFGGGAAHFQQQAMLQQLPGGPPLMR